MGSRSSEGSKGVCVTQGLGMSRREGEGWPGHPAPAGQVGGYVGDPGAEWSGVGGRRSANPEPALLVPAMFWVLYTLDYVVGTKSRNQMELRVCLAVGGGVRGGPCHVPAPSRSCCWIPPVWWPGLQGKPFRSPLDSRIPWCRPSCLPSSMTKTTF